MFFSTTTDLVFPLCMVVAVGRLKNSNFGKTNSSKILAYIFYVVAAAGLGTV